jgi:hypothetical protein
MRRVWIGAPAASIAMMLLVVACRATEPREGDAVESAEANLSAQGKAKANAFLDDAAVSWVSKDDWGFVQGGRCVMSCHTTVPFMLVKGAHAPNALDAATSALDAVRGHVEARVNGWATAAPLYSWVADDSRGLEAVLNALALVAADAPTGTLSVTAKKALANMWAEQKADGSFPWWTTFTLAPWENADAGVWGTAIADYAVGLAPASYVANLSGAEKAKLAKLEQWLASKAAQTTVPLHNRAMIVLAAARRPTLLDATTKEDIADGVRALQTIDGSWPASSLGFAVAGGTTNASSAHAYATAYYAYVLAENADPVDATRVTKARQWLDVHQRTDGAWEAKSLNSPTDAWNNQLMTEAATAWGILASGN